MVCLRDTRRSSERTCVLHTQMNITIHGDSTVEHLDRKNKPNSLPTTISMSHHMLEVSELLHVHLHLWID